MTDPKAQFPKAQSPQAQSPQAQPAGAQAPDDLPFFLTWSAQRRGQPLEMVGGQGCSVVLADGRRILDLGSLSYQANLGHAHPEIIEAVQKQAAKQCVSLPGAVFPEKLALAKKLLSLAPPGFSKVFFTLGGAEANENALKIARMVTGRHKLISRYRSYHGASMGAVTLSGDWRRAPVEPGIPGVVHVLDLDESQAGAPSQIPRVLELEGNVGGVFLESVVGANGVLIPPPGYFRDVREACDRHGALLVVDEVLTGFGRTGKWFGFEHFDGVVPDMITIGKALTAGYGILGAVLVHERVAKHFDENVLVAGLTHYGHPLGIAAALASIEIYERDKLIERSARLQATLEQAHRQWHKDMPTIVGKGRALGLLSASELNLSRAGFVRLGKALSNREVMAHIAPGVSALILAPPLNIPEQELDDGLRRVGQAIAEAAPGD